MRSASPALPVFNRHKTNWASSKRSSAYAAGLAMTASAARGVSSRMMTTIVIVIVIGASGTAIVIVIATVIATAIAIETAGTVPAWGRLWSVTDDAPTRLKEVGPAVFRCR
jgi:hypothetical protein